MQFISKITFTSFSTRQTTRDMSLQSRKEKTVITCFVLAVVQAPMSALHHVPVLYLHRLDSLSI